MREPLVLGTFFFAVSSVGVLSLVVSLTCIASDLLRNIRTEVMIKLIRPYTRVRIPFICEQLKITEAEVEALLVNCILDKLVGTVCFFSHVFSNTNFPLFLHPVIFRSINGRIDQVNRVVVLDPQSDGVQKYDSLLRWTQKLERISHALTEKV